MDFTPVQSSTSHDSGCISASFDASKSIFESTPNDLCTPNFITSRKRKASQFRNVQARKLADSMENCTFTPPASSTFNESLINNLEKFNLVENTFELSDDIGEPPNKFVKGKTCSRIRSAPSTPQKQILHYEKKSSSVSYSCKTLPYISESPLNEKNDILYPSLKPVSVRKILTPQKFRESLNQDSLPKKCLLIDKNTNRTLKLLDKITGINVIMEKVFGFLSNGDLYRLSYVSKCFKNAILINGNAAKRFEIYVEQHKLNKENYEITPPSSPEKNDTPPVSPGSMHFYNFLNVAKELDSSQTQMKCLQCGGPSVVTGNIAQCTLITCGFIYCKSCASCSVTGPENFIDKCGKSVLHYQAKREFADLSNILYINSSTPTYSIFSSPSHNYSSLMERSSGYCSETEQRVAVRRNLSSSFATPTDRSRILTANNMHTSAHQKAKRKSLMTPITKVTSVKEVNEIIQPPSPPSPIKIQEPAVCSKRSKRNLKRLTR